MSTVTDLFSIVRELSLDNLAREAELAPSILIVGEGAARERLAGRLFGPASAAFVTAREATPTEEGLRFDIALYLWTGGAADAFRTQLGAARRHGWPVLVVRATSEALPAGTDLPGETVDLAADDANAVEEARRRITSAFEEDRLLALGRHLPQFRHHVSLDLIERTSRVNAQFSALAGLPAILPFIGNVFTIGADFLILTKNQMLLIFKLAAIYGRDLEDRRQIYVEMIPVVGAAFLWRTIGRELIGLLPALLAMLPRVGVAYLGTYVVGRAGQYYYEEGRAPTREDWDRFTKQALHWFDNFRPARRLTPASTPAAAANPGIAAPPAALDDSATVH
jgi:hypothetical protein